MATLHLLCKNLTCLMDNQTSFQVGKMWKPKSMLHFIILTMNQHILYSRPVSLRCVYNPSKVPSLDQNFLPPYRMVLTVEMDSQSNALSTSYNCKKPYRKSRASSEKEKHTTFWHVDISNLNVRVIIH